MLLKKYLQEMLLGVIIVLILGLYTLLGLFYFYYNEETEVVINETKKELVTEEDSKTKQISYVEVKGAVEVPGVFQINENAILNDIIIKAGGFKKDAYTNNLNLSKKLKDETVIYVYTKYEYSKINKKEEPTIIVKECNCPEIDINACLNNGSSIIESDNNVESSDEETIKNEVTNNNEISKEETNNVEVTDKRININTATKDELITLNGIGDAKAQKIIDYRKENGDFKNIEDIKLVSGISDALFEKIKDSIKV